MKRVVSIEGVFDRAAATLIRTKLGDPACDVIVLDFRRTREVSDSALAVLAAAIAKRSSPRVALRGLGQHQKRMLRYLRIDDAIDDAD